MYIGMSKVTIISRKVDDEIKKYKVAFNESELESDINNLRIEILSMDDLCMKDKYNYLMLYYHLTSIKDGYDESLNILCDVYSLIDEESCKFEKAFFPVWYNEIHNIFTVEEIKEKKLELNNVKRGINKYDVR